VVLAIAALAAGLIYAYNQSETFRKFVDGAFSAVKIAAMTLAKVAVGAFKFMANVWMTVVGAIIDGAAAAFGWIPGIGPKLQTAAGKFHDFKNSANAELSKIENDLQVAIDTERAKQSIDGLVSYWRQRSKQIGQTDLSTDRIDRRSPGRRAAGGPAVAGRPYVVGERRPELFVPDTNGRIIPNAGGAGSGGGMSESDIQRLAVAMSQVQLQVQVSAGQVDRSLGGWRA
jgi:hypothetical protein